MPRFVSSWVGSGWRSAPPTWFYRKSLHALIIMLTCTVKRSSCPPGSPVRAAGQTSFSTPQNRYNRSPAATDSGAGQSFTVFGARAVMDDSGLMIVRSEGLSSIVRPEPDSAKKKSAASAAAVARRRRLLQVGLIAPRASIDAPLARVRVTKAVWCRMPVSFNPPDT